MNNGVGPESNFIGGFTKVIDTVVLGMLWLLCCIPVFTVGAASSALYYTYHKSVRQDRGHICKTFFGAFGSNFKQTTGIWLVLLVFMLLSGFALFVLLIFRQSIPAAGILLSMGGIIMGSVLAWSLILFPYQARFENTAATVLKNSSVLAFANAPRALLLLLCFAGAIAVSVYKPATVSLAVALYIWLTNKLLEPVFRKLMTEDELKKELELDGK